MASTKHRVMLISRTDGTRGPLGVARAINMELASYPDCRTVEVGGGFGMIRLFLRIAFAMKGWSVCIHANGYRIPLLMLWASRINKGNRYFCVIHGVVNVEKEYRPVSEKDTKLEPYVFKRFQNVICVSDFERKRLFEMYGARNRVFVIHNGVEPGAGTGVSQCKAVSLALHEPVFITTGGFERRKAVDLALEVLGELKRLGTNPKLVVCGRDSKETGSNRELCEQMAKEAGIEMVYEGEIKDKDRLRKLYDQAHFYIGLSRFDTFNVSVLEGAAAGCVPVISTLCGACELFDEKSSIVVDIEHGQFAGETSQRIVNLISNNEEYRTASENARQIARLNTWSDVSKQYWKVLSHE